MQPSASFEISDVTSASKLSILCYRIIIIARACTRRCITKVNNTSRHHVCTFANGPLLLQLINGLQMSRITPSMRCTRYTEGPGASGGACRGAALPRHPPKFSGRFELWIVVNIDGETHFCDTHAINDQVKCFIGSGERGDALYTAALRPFTLVIPAELLRFLYCFNYRYTLKVFRMHKRRSLKIVEIFMVSNSCSCMFVSVYTNLKNAIFYIIFTY